jgi:hypothetical protein
MGGESQVNWRESARGMALGGALVGLTLKANERQVHGDFMLATSKGSLLRPIPPSSW